jgi:phosphate transport system substrate-binding protein
MRRTLVRDMLLLSLVLFAAQFPAYGQETPTMRIALESWIADPVEECVASLRETNPECRTALFAVQPEEAMDQLVQGQLSAAVLARKMDAETRRRAAEKGGQISEKQLGYVSLAVIVNANLPTEYLTMDQARKVFTGEISNWKALGGPDKPIEVITRHSPEHEAAVVFQRDVLKGAGYARQARIVQSYQTMASVCGKSNAIGYVPTASIWYQKTVDAGAKAITIAIDEKSRAIHAPVGLVADSEYPIKVPVVIYWRKDVAPKCLDSLISLIERSVQ